MDPFTFYMDEYDVPPTKAQHDRMVANENHPVTFRAEHYARLGHCPDDVQRPRGARAYHMRVAS